MKKLSNLFYECAYRGNWQTINTVDYKFIENEKEHTLEIYFMGSSQTLDWVRNFLFKKKPYKDMKVPYKVHRGFLEAWKEVEDIIINKITEVKPLKALVKKSKEKQLAVATADPKKYKWQEIVVVGYSHGGALSGLCHECVWYHRPDLRESGLVGFGFESPRFYGGFRVKSELKERWEHYTVIRTGNDIVTHCPPAIVKYCHVGNLLRIGKKNKWAPIKNHTQTVVYGSLIEYEEGESKK